MNKLPFTRPTLGEAEFAAVTEVLQSGWITTGPKVAQLEQDLADYIGGGVSVRVFNNATIAMEAILVAQGIGPGDEVILPAMSFVASANVVVRVGAKPVFVDVDLASRNICTDQVKQAISTRTRAILPVHLCGLSADLDPLRALATEHDCLLLEDAAQAIGTRYKGAQIGSEGNPVAFSFHANKNMTTIEGGAVASRDPGLIKQLEALRFHGISRNPAGDMLVEEWGGKMNMSDVNAAIGIIQLQKLEGFNARRRELTQQYFKSLPQHPALLLPQDAPGHSWHMFCICLDFAALSTSRKEVVESFAEVGIALGYHYPAMHLFGLYRRYGYQAGDFPATEQIAEQTLTLPLFPGMTADDVERVCTHLAALLK